MSIGVQQTWPTARVYYALIPHVCSDSRLNFSVFKVETDEEFDRNATRIRVARSLAMHRAAIVQYANSIMDVLDA